MKREDGNPDHSGKSRDNYLAFIVNEVRSQLVHLVEGGDMIIIIIVFLAASSASRSSLARDRHSCDLCHGCGNAGSLTCHVYLHFLASPFVVFYHKGLDTAPCAIQ